MFEIVTEARKIMGRLAKGDDLLGALMNICQDQGITLGEVKAIGAVSQARVGYYHQDTRQYEWLDLNRHLEILALEGNISLKDGLSAATWPKGPSSLPRNLSSRSSRPTARSIGRWTRRRGCFCGRRSEGS